MKGTSEAKREHGTNAFSFDFHNGLNGSVDLFATSNGSAISDSEAHHAGDMQAYSCGLGNSSTDLFAMSSQPIDLFATCNGISAVHSGIIFGFDFAPSMASNMSIFQHQMVDVSKKRVMLHWNLIQLLGVVNPMRILGNLQQHLQILD